TTPCSCSRDGAKSKPTIPGPSLSGRRMTCLPLAKSLPTLYRLLGKGCCGECCPLEAAFSRFFSPSSCERGPPGWVKSSHCPHCPVSMSTPARRAHEMDTSVHHRFDDCIFGACRMVASWGC